MCVLGPKCPFSHSVCVCVMSQPGVLCKLSGAPLCVCVCTPRVHEQRSIEVIGCSTLLLGISFVCVFVCVFQECGKDL